MRRREFIAGVAGSTAAWPLSVRAQQTERARRIGILLPATADDLDFSGLGRGLPAGFGAVKLGRWPQTDFCRAWAGMLYGIFLDSE